MSAETGGTYSNVVVVLSLVFQKPLSAGSDTVNVIVVFGWSVGITRGRLPVKVAPPVAFVTARRNGRSTSGFAVWQVATVGFRTVVQSPVVPSVIPTGSDVRLIWTVGGRVGSPLIVNANDCVDESYLALANPTFVSTTTGPGGVDVGGGSVAGGGGVEGECEGEGECDGVGGCEADGCGADGEVPGVCCVAG
jgi:hypothetical protein